MSDEYHKLPRIFLDQDIEQNVQLILDEGPAHYFRSVLRRQAGDQFRVINGRDGEWVAKLTSLDKKNATAIAKKLIRPQPAPSQPLHLVFSPIKKQRMNFLIEKAVELGVTDLHPILTARTDNRKINETRMQAQIIEALEQCERMHPPKLHPLTDMKVALKKWAYTPLINACIERHESTPINMISKTEQAFLIGPEGGFNDDEINFLTSQNHIRAISLGETVYRAETACIICLVQSNNFA